MLKCWFRVSQHKSDEKEWKWWWWWCVRVFVRGQGCSWNNAFHCLLYVLFSSVHKYTGTHRICATPLHRQPLHENSIKDYHFPPWCKNFFTFTFTLSSLIFNATSFNAFFRVFFYRKVPLNERLRAHFTNIFAFTSKCTISRFKLKIFQLDARMSVHFGSILTDGLTTRIKLGVYVLRNRSHWKYRW